VALAGVLLLGILQGILLAALASMLMMLVRASRPHVAFLGRVPGTSRYGDVARHPENEPIPGVLAFRPDGSLLYVNAENVMEVVLARLAAQPPAAIRLVVCDLSASPHMDLPAVAMLRKLHATLSAQGIRLVAAGAHGGVRDLLRRDGIGDLLGGVARDVTLEGVLEGEAAGPT
jgi:sulfate permease, SulP family